MSIPHTASQPLTFLTSTRQNSLISLEWYVSPEMLQKVICRALELSLKS